MKNLDSIRNWGMVVFWSFCLLFLAGSCSRKAKITDEQLALIPYAQRDGLPAPSGGFVLGINGETVSSEEVVAPLVSKFVPLAKRVGFEQFALQARGTVEQVVVGRISNIVLYQRARSELGDNIDDVLERAVEAEVQKFVIGFGGDLSRAEESLEQMGMNWAEFSDYQKKMIISQSYIQEQMPENKPITYSNLVEYYDEIKGKAFTKQESIEFRLIDIQPDKIISADPNADRGQVAAALVADIVSQIRGGKDFGELAKSHSHGHRAALGGLWKPVKPESLAEPYDILAAQASKMQAGDVAEPIVAGDHVFIMKLESKEASEVEPFEKVQKQVEAEYIFQRRKRVVDEISNELVRQAAGAEREAFVDFCIWQLYAVCIGQVGG